MAKRIPVQCSPENCGSNYDKCGTSCGYFNRKCRCSACAEYCRVRSQKRWTEVKTRAVDPLTVRHATWQGYYNDRCRCDDCRAAAREYDRRREADYQRPTPKPELLAHGLSGYVTYKCRCQVCVQWSRDNARKRRESLVDNPTPFAELTHGAATAYVTHKCRCRLCCAWYSDWKLGRIERDRALGRLHAQVRRLRKKNATVIEFTADQWAQKSAYWGDKCYLQIPGVCTGAADEVEHVKPLSKGGLHTLANVRPACLPCNRTKGSKWPFEGA